MFNKKDIKENNKFFKLIFEPDKTFTKEYETFLNSLFGLKYTNEEKSYPVFTFGIISKGDNTEFYVAIPESYENIFKKKYAVINSYIEFSEIDDPMIKFSNLNENDQTHHVLGYNMKLYDEDSNKKLKTVNADKLFLNNILHSMNNVVTGDTSIVEISVKPAGLSTQQQRDHNNLLIKGAIGLGNMVFGTLEYLLNGVVIDTGGSTSKTNSRIEPSIIRTVGSKYEQDEIAYNYSPRFYVSIKLISKSTEYKNVLDNVKGMAAVFSDLSESNSLVPVKIKYDDIVKREMKHINVLSTPEIVQFLHLPDNTVSSDNVTTSNCKKIYDRNVPTEGVVFGDSNNKNVAFTMVPISPENYSKKYDDIQKIIDNLVKPRLVLGQQGTGKSEWLINYIIALAKFGMSVIVVDPKNDTQQRLIESLPNDLLKKVDYINFGDTDYPPAMNIFKQRLVNDPTENSLIVSSFISLMKKEFKNWGFHIQRILQNTAEAILLDDISTLHEFEAMLTEREYREYMIMKMKAMLSNDDVTSKGHIKKLVKYWEQFNSMDDKYIIKDIEPVMNQIGVFLSNRIIKGFVCQKQSYDFRKAADEGRIVIINIPEGVLRDNTKLLSSMINKSIWLDLQSRANVDISQRYPTAWIIDEAHEVVDDEFISILTKARAYRLGVTLVTQGLTNFKMRGMEDIRELILTNCKNKIMFRLGRNDSMDLKEEMDPLGFVDLNNCPDYHFYAKIILDNGNISNPFFVHAPKVAKKLRDYEKYVKNHRSGKYTIDEIEDELEERMDRVNVFNALLF